MEKTVTAIVTENAISISLVHSQGRRGKKAPAKNPIKEAKDAFHGEPPNSSGSILSSSNACYFTCCSSELLERSLTII